MLNAILAAIGEIMAILNIPTKEGQNTLIFVEFLIVFFTFPIAVIMKIIGLFRK